MHQGDKSHGQEEKNSWGTLTEQERRDSRAGLRVLMIGFTAFVAFATVIGIITAIANTVESAAVADRYGDPIASACQPVPVGSLSADNLPNAEPPRQLVLFIADKQRRHAWHADLSTQWRAEDGESVAIIGCVDEDYIELEECTYTREAERNDTYTVRVTREQHTATVTLINPVDGRRIDEITLTGPEPGPCPPDEAVTTSGRERGDDLTWADFGVWAEGYVLD